VPLQTSQLPLSTRAVAFGGSIVVCARYGASYMTESFVAAEAKAASTSPSLRATAPGLATSSRCRAVIPSLDRVAFGPSFHVMFRRLRPSIAAQLLVASTAMPRL